MSFHFSLGAIREIKPRERIVLVHNRAAFDKRYGSKGIKIAGVYLGYMDNGYGEVELRSPFEVRVARAAYESEWISGTNSSDYSLVAAKAKSDLTEKSEWVQSRPLAAKPGR